MDNLLYIHHVVQRAFSPPLNGWIFILIGLLGWRWRKFMLSCFFFSILFVYLQYTPFFAQTLTNLTYPKFDSSYNIEKSAPQAIVVLGAGVCVDIGQFGEFEGYPCGVSLLNAQVAAKIAIENPDLPILLSGGVTADNFSEAGAMSEYLQDNYALLNAEILESKSLNTSQNATFTAAKLNQLGITRIILVTQASHMWRSLALFNKQGIYAIAYPAWDLYSDSHLTWWQKITPNRSAAVQMQKELHEMIGYLIYVIF